MAVVNFMTPPTDNLWKFIMISALIALLALGYFVNDNLDATSKYHAEIGRLFSQLQIEVEPLFSKRDALTAEILKEKEPSAQQKLERERQNVINDILLHPTQKRIDDLSVKSGVAGEKVSVERLKHLGIYASSAFFFLLFGGIMWYYKLQRIDDRKASIQLRLLELELEGKEKASSLQSAAAPPKTDMSANI